MAFSWWDASTMLLEIAVAIIFAKLFSSLFERIKQPGVIGEITAGIFLGPCCLGLLSGASLMLMNTPLYTFKLNLASPEFKDIAYIGAIFLLFIVGMETDMSELKKTKKTGLFVGMFGILVPFAFGCLVGTIFHFTLVQSMAIGTIFLATSATIALRLMSDMDLLSTRIGLTLRTALVVNDILAMVFFALVFGAGNSFVLLLQIGLFFGLALFAGFLLVHFALKRNTKRHAPAIVLTSGLATCLLFAAFAENLGLTAIIGAFLAGLFVKKTPEARVMIDYIKTIGYAFFVPLFFVWIGANFDFLSIFASKELASLLVFCLVFIVFAMSGNFLGSALGARLSGFKTREAVSVGIGMMPIMGVALIIVTAGIDRGVFGDPAGVIASQIKVATLLLIFTSCIVTPILMKKSLGSPLSKKLGSKTKLSSYHHPHCTLCNSPLRLDPQSNGWYCDSCGHSVRPPARHPSRTLQNLRMYNSRWVMYIIGGSTILICGLTIPNMAGVSIYTKISALLGIFLGTTLAYLTIHFLFARPKDPVRPSQKDLIVRH
jgi:Kef-type K+ transport system membrane component KefB